ncbi:acid protease [Diplodia corticola]|uniref:Acid protease n=1 Tax=Diplodia corticola TaxID=236234 RepID=A0A1J9RYM8_9PEZI|nr:acid protease [Diplodia corticola]OJD33455.1 acid protease [Diplodia corticola]
MKKSIFRLLGLAASAGGQALEPSGALQPRDTVTTLAAPLSLSPSQFWDGNDGEWTSYNLRLGAPQPQNVRVFPSTKSNYIWAIDPRGCPDQWYPGQDPVKDCEDNRGGFFDGNNSVGWTELSVYKLHVDEDIGYEGANGVFGFDQVGLDYLGAGGNLNHQLIAATAYPGFWFGVLPLNPRPVNTSDMNSPQKSFLQSLKDANNISSLSWGYTAGAKYRSENFFGSLVLGGYDAARFDNYTQITVPFSADTERDLSIQVNSIKTSYTLGSLTAGAMTFVIDSTVPYIYLPESSYMQLEKTFGLEWNDTAELYLINKTQYNDLIRQESEITFNVGTTYTTDIVFPIAAFLPTATFPLLGADSPESSHYFPIKRANDTRTLTLGRTFLQEAYLIYDYERSTFTIAQCVWPTDTAASPPSAPTIIRSINDTGSNDPANPNPNPSNPTLSAAAIAGVAIAGVVAGLLLASLITCIWLRRRRRRRASSSRRGRHSSTATTSSTAKSPTSTNSRLLATFFRNPWGSLSSPSSSSSPWSPYATTSAGANANAANNDDNNEEDPSTQQVVPGRYELPHDPHAPTPAERAASEHKRQRSSELDAELSAVHEMCQHQQPVVVVGSNNNKEGEAPAPAEMAGDDVGPLPMTTSMEGNVLREGVEGEREWRERERERTERERERAGGVYEMDAAAAATATARTLPRFGGQQFVDRAVAVARKEGEERERLEAERGRGREAAMRRWRPTGRPGEELGGGVDVDGGVDAIESLGGVSPPLSSAAANSAAAAAASDRPDTERRVSDLSPISENSGFVVGSPTSSFRPDSGSRRVSRD